MNVRRRREAVQSYFYLSPAALIFLVFTVIPVLYVVYISFFNWSFYNTSQSTYIGLGNYAEVIKYPEFWHSLWISLYFVLATVPTGIVFSLGIAMLLMRRIPLRGLVRLAVFSPYVTPVVATTIIWVWIFNPQFGLLNGVLHLVHLPELGWLESPHWAMPAIAIYTLWHGLGFDVIIFLAGLSTIAKDLGESARIDGANAWQEFYHVTWPLLSPTTLFVLIISTVGSLQAYTQFYTMTGGGPLNATTTTSYLLYQMAFMYNHMGFGAALAVVLFFIIAGLTLLQLKVSNRYTFYQ
jgi:multiple sugar transport system permease protein